MASAEAGPAPAMTALEALRLLEGRWRGTGRGAFSTIRPFEFEEETTFSFAPEYPLLRYEQRTVLLPGRAASHWELGFFRPVAEGMVEVSNAQESGRVEVLRGAHAALDGACAGGFRLSLRKHSLGNDPRVLETERIITLSGGTLHYEKYMVTTTTAQPVREKHLEAWLARA